MQRRRPVRQCQGVTIEIQPTDADLCAELADGDRAAFDRLFDRHVQAVANHCFRLSASWPAAEDLTQATFLTAWRRRGEIRVVAGSALPWLLAVATNNARTEWRRQRRWLAAIRRMPAAAATADPADEIAGRIDDQRRMEPILAAVRRLPRAQREAIALCVWSGLSYADAAQALGIDEVSVRSRVSRARARLARLLGNDDDQQEKR
jgi:RNA polymerase sigma factor (sigma-70 family)